MFELLAATGVRRSELLAFEVRHLALDSERPHVKVRQRVRRRKGIGLVVGPLKSRHARSDLPVPLEVADRLLPLVAGRGDRELVFRSTDRDDPRPGQSGRPDPRAGVLGSRRGVGRLSHLQAYGGVAACSPRAATWCRCSAGSGTTSPSFTLDTYVHLLADDLGEPLAPLGRPSVSQDRSGRVKKKSSERPETPANGAPRVAAETND